MTKQSTTPKKKAHRPRPKKKSLTLIEEFAKRHGLKTQPHVYKLFDETRRRVSRHELSHVIFDDADGWNLTIHDPAEDKNYRNQSRMKGRLLFTMWGAKRRHTLNHLIGFDVTSCYSPRRAEDSTPPDWGRLFRKLHIQFVAISGDEFTMSFPAGDIAAETMVLALAKVPRAECDEEAKKVPGETAWVCRWVSPSLPDPDDDLPF